jgi:hypothetical protein
LLCLENIKNALNIYIYVGIEAQILLKAKVNYPNTTYVLFPEAEIQVCGEGRGIIISITSGYELFKTPQRNSLILI